VTTPPKLEVPEVLDFAAIRLRLAGLADPEADRPLISAAITRDLATRYLTILADLFGESLERITLWSKIDSAVASALAKVGPSDDVARFASLCLETIAADPSRVAACLPLGVVLETLGHSNTDRIQFLDYLRDHRYPVLVFARSRWDHVKKKEVDL